MVKLNVKVITTDATKWYRVGETHTVYRFGSTYVVAEDFDGDPTCPWRQIWPADVEVA